MSYKGLLVLRRSKATASNNVYTFKFDRGIAFKRWRIRNVKHNSAQVKLFLHVPTLMAKTVNNSIDGEGYNTDMVMLLSDSLTHNTDRHTLYLNSAVVFYELDVFFSDGQGTKINVTDFDILIDYEKKTGIY